jgi:phosphoribosylformylglycinamidine synthase I
MRIAIVQFPGSNCERETILAVKRAQMEPVEFLWNQAKEQLSSFDGYVVVGGFSYEDRSRSGIIAALDPLMKTLGEESQKGKPLLGICNGAQILVEAGLVPGLKHQQLGAALTNNKRQRQGKILGTGFYNAWVNLRLTDHYQKGAFTRHLNPRKVLELPIAHAEGRFIIPPALLSEMQAQGLNLFQYCTPQGDIEDEFPTNPNGSVNNLAAITNKMGNVMAMMPHPERTERGDAIFQSMRDYIAEGNYKPTSTLTYEPLTTPIESYCPNPDSRELLVELMITDNETLSVLNELKRAALPVNLRRQTHWELICDSQATYDKIINSDLLYNKRKEFAHTSPSSTKRQQEVSFLVHAKDDVLGLQKKQLLEKYFGIKGVHSIRHSVLWRVQAETNLDLFTHKILNSHILFNPYAHDCYYY